MRPFSIVTQGISEERWNMATEGYEPEDERTAFAHVLEECGEVIQAYGKCMRFGWDSVWSEQIHDESLKTNEETLFEEMNDLYKALKRWKKFNNG